MKLAPFTVAVLSAALISGAASAQTIAIATTKGGATAQISAAIAKIVSRHAEGVQMRTRPFGGTQQYIPIVNNGEVAIGLSNLPQYHMAQTGTGMSKRPYTNLRLMAKMMVFQVGLLVPNNSDIRSSSDLRGKRIPHGFKAAPLFDFMIRGWLANGGMSYDDVQKVPTVALRQHWNIFAQGKTDMSVAAVGTGRVKELNAKISGGVRYATLDPAPAAQRALFKIYPKSYLKKVHPAKRLTAIRSPVYTLNYDYTLWTHKDMDDKIVYKIVKAMYEHEADLKKSSPLWRSHASKTMAKDIGFAFHVGAETFYKEVGIWKR